MNVRETLTVAAFLIITLLMFAVGLGHVFDVIAAWIQG